MAFAKAVLVPQFRAQVIEIRDRESLRRGPKSIQPHSRHAGLRIRQPTRGRGGHLEVERVRGQGSLQQETGEALPTQLSSVRFHKKT
jgi:hypothetical protein